LAEIKAAVLDRVATVPFQFHGKRLPCFPAVIKARASRFFLGLNRAVVPKSIAEANRCILGHLAPKTRQKAL